MIEPYVIVGPDGSGLEEIKDVVRAFSEDNAWTIALGWILEVDKEVSYFKSAGWYCTKANLTWTKTEV